MRSALICLLALGCAAPAPRPAATDPVATAAGPPSALAVGSPSGAEAASPEPSPDPGLAASAVPEQALAPPPPLPEGTTVLLVGSSTAGAIGPALKQELEARGIACIVKGQDASYIPEWAGEKMGLRQLVARYEPDLVLVSLGGNEVEIGDPASRAGAIRRVVAAIGGRPCVWIGTPKWKALRHNGILEVIRENCAPCRFFDSDQLVPNMETFRDGVHPTVAERRRWASVLVQWLEQNRDPDGALPWSFRAAAGSEPPEGE